MLLFPHGIMNMLMEDRFYYYKTIKTMIKDDGYCLRMQSVSGCGIGIRTDLVR